nr:reverse transcriptase domain-containing protein [Tanacetum cinerariifolium]
MDDKPMWAANRVVTLTPGSAITIPKTANEFAIKDGMPMSREEEAKFMQTFRKTRFYNDYRDRDSNSDNWCSSERNDYNRDNYRSNTDDKSYDVKKEFNDFMKSHQSTNAFVNETFMNLKTQLKTIAKNHQASIKNLKPKFDRLADKQSGRPSGSLPIAFLSDESSAMIQNKVPPKLRDPESFLIPCNLKTFSCNALADLGASINLMPYSLYGKLSLKTLRPTKITVRLADRSFQYLVGIAENMLVEVGKFTFPADFVILEMEEDSKKQLNLRVGTKRMIFSIDSAMKHSYSNDDTCFSINVIDEILKEDFDALLDEGSKVLHSIEGTLLEEEIFSKFDEFMAMTADEISESESDIKEPPFEKITINTNYKIKTSFKEPPMDLKLKPLPDNLEYNPSKYSWMISSYFEDSFDKYLNNLDKMLQRYKDAHPALNWGKCHFMVKEGIVLGHKVSSAGLEVDKAKINIISKLPPLLTSK